MNLITEYDLLELETELSEIRFVSEGIDIKSYFNIFKRFAKLTPDKLVNQMDKLYAIPAKLKLAIVSGKRIIQNKVYFDQCKEFIQSKTYFSDNDVNKLMKSVSKVLDTYKPSKSDMDANTIKPIAWAMTTLSIAIFSKNNPHKRLSVPEAIAYVKHTCRSIKTKISLKSNEKVSHLFFIFLIVFLINLTVMLSVKAQLLPRYLAISSVLAYIFYLNYFLEKNSKTGKEIKEQVDIVNESLINFKPYSDKIFSIVNKLGKRAIDPKFFIKNIFSVEKMFKGVVPKIKNIISTFSDFTLTAEEYVKKNSDLNMTEISSTARQITKYVMSIFDISQRATLLLPISWLAIIFIVVKWKERNPGKKITKEIILKSAKEYFYKANLKWSKYKAQTSSQKMMVGLSIPYLYFSFLVFFPKVIKYMEQDLSHIKYLYSAIAAIYMLAAISAATQSLEKND